MEQRTDFKLYFKTTDFILKLFTLKHDFKTAKESKKPERIFLLKLNIQVSKNSWMPDLKRRK